MKILKPLIFILALVIVSCSSDDDGMSTTNKIQIGNESFPVNSVFLETRNDNTFMYFFNKSEAEILANLTNGQTLNNVNYMYLEINQAPLDLTTYHLEAITDYELITDSTLIADELDDNGTLVLESDDAILSASTASTSITSFTAEALSLNFSFTRTDGLEVTGNFSGNYSSLENNSAE